MPIRPYTKEEIIATCDQIEAVGFNLPIFESGQHIFAMLKSLALLLPDAPKEEVKTDEHSI